MSCMVAVERNKVETGSLLIQSEEDIQVNNISSEPAETTWILSSSGTFNSCSLQILLYLQHALVDFYFKVE